MTSDGGALAEKEPGRGNGLQRDDGDCALLQRYTEEQVMEAMSKSQGQLFRLAKILDCRPHELQLLLPVHSRLGRFWTQCRADCVAEAEQAMAELMSSEDEDVRFKAAKFVLQTLGRREWGTPAQGVEVTQGPDQTLSIRAIFGMKEE